MLDEGEKALDEKSVTAKYSLNTTHFIPFPVLDNNGPVKTNKEITLFNEQKGNSEQITITSKKTLQYIFSTTLR